MMTDSSSMWLMTYWCSLLQVQCDVYGVADEVLMSYIYLRQCVSFYIRVDQLYLLLHLQRAADWSIRRLQTGLRSGWICAPKLSVRESCVSYYYSILEICQFNSSYSTETAQRLFADGWVTLGKPLETAVVSCVAEKPSLIEYSSLLLIMI